MSWFGQVIQIARRDFLQRVRSRAFLITMALTVGLVLAAGPLIALATGEPEPDQIGLVGEVEPTVEAAIIATASTIDFLVETKRIDSIDEAEQMLSDGDLDVILVDSRELVWDEFPRATLSGIITTAVQAVERAAVLETLGLTAEQAAQLEPQPLDERTLAEADPERIPRIIGANIGVILMYMSLLLFGQFVMMGVMEEKSNRVVEVLLSRVTPDQVLTGKVMGIGLLGLIQFLALGAASFVTLLIIEVDNVELPSLGAPIIVSVIFWYLLGYAFFSVIYGALGATVSRQEDSQGVVMIPVLLLLPGYFIGLLSIEDPDSVLARITSWIPPTSPIVMPMRTAVSDVPLWEIVVAVVLICVAVYFLIRLGGRIYRGAILRLGARVKLLDAWRSAEG